MRAAMYARFSTDKQRDASIEDQALNCRKRNKVDIRRARAVAAGANIRQGIERAGHRPGRNPGFLFSGLLKCGVCASSMVIAGGSGKSKCYGCAGRKDGGANACGNGLTVRKSIVEARLLGPIKHDLLSDEVLAEFRKRVARALSVRPASESNALRINQLRVDVANLADATSMLWHRPPC